MLNQTKNSVGLSEKSNDRMRQGGGRGSLRSNSKGPLQDNAMLALEEQLAIVSPNKDDEIDDDFAELIVNKTNSID